MNTPIVLLNDGNYIPQLGFGLWQVSDEETVKSVGHAFNTGYRSIDSAQVYQNEKGLGEAIRQSNIKRDELFITTKIWNAEQGRDSTLKSFDVSMQKLGLEKLDLLLIHWPAPKKMLYVETWKALIQLKKDQRVTSIGVSNFTTEHLKTIIDATSVIPVLNQVELHPEFQQQELCAYHELHNIKTEAWSPLGQGKVINNEGIKKIAEKYKKSPAQIILRWHMEKGNIAIPKSITPARISENFQVFDFKLDEEDMKLIATLDRAEGRIGPDPMTADF